MPTEVTDWPGNQQPLDPEASEAQIAGLLEMLGSSPRRVLDLGCGIGRVLLPLAAAGHVVVGIDRDRETLSSCRRSLADTNGEAKLIEMDMCGDWPDDLGRFDLVCCLGNTFMLLADVDDAVRLLRKVRAALLTDGSFVIDNLPHEYWPELTAGNWQSGVSEDGCSQLVWSPDDAVFAIRTGGEVDTDCWQLKTSDTRLRLWTSGALRLACELSGLSIPEGQVEWRVMVMRSEKT
ncbi:MAG: class I SAM-dependent methyltransferase [Planctomycetes bacterium]|nr:class I SAM-dependent methyltransferase [Planctomycetota bacterium]